MYIFTCYTYHPLIKLKRTFPYDLIVLFLEPLIVPPVVFIPPLPLFSIVIALAIQSIVPFSLISTYFYQLFLDGHVRMLVKIIILCYHNLVILK